MTTPRQPTDPVTLIFEAQQVNVLIGLLMDHAPWRVADPILRSIGEQTTTPEDAPIADQVPPHKSNGELRQDDAAATA